MAKKKLQLKKKIKKGDAVPSEAKQVELQDPFDYGGLPTRDIKKNLGCG